MAQFPSARVYIQVMETKEVIFCDTFSSIDTSLRTDGISTATVQLINKADKWYTFYGRDTRKQTDLSQFLLDAYSTPRFVDLNFKRQDLLLQAQRAKEQKLADIMEKIYGMEQLCLLDLAYRIWIDFRGRKDLIDLQKPSPKKYANVPERWYAGFTGIITNVEDAMTPGKEQTLTLNCKDMKRLFETTYLTTAQGFNPVLSLNTEGGTQKWVNGYLTSALSGYIDGGAIIRYAADTVNRTFHQKDDAGNPDSSNFYPYSKFWQLPNITGGTEQQPNAIVVQPDYNGITNRRTPLGFANQIAQQNDSEKSLPMIPDQIQSAIVQKLLTKADMIKFINRENSLAEYSDSFDLKEMRASFNPDKFVDRSKQQVEGTDTYQGASYSEDVMIENGNINSNPYQQMIRKVFEQDTSRCIALEAIRAVAGLTGYYCYCDAKGNLIYQKSRYDDLPAMDDPNADYDLADQSIGIPMMDEFGTYAKPSTQERSKYGMRFHGRNYIVGDESLQGWRITKDESSIVTHVIVPSDLELIDVGQDLQKYITGVGFASPDIIRKFGARIYSAKPIMQPGFNQLIPQILASGLVRRINAKAMTCQLSFNQRPDFQLGRTLYMMERRLLFFITEVRNSIQWGQKFKTVVSGQYGHNPYSPILDPWRMASLSQGPQTPDEALGDNENSKNELEEFLGGYLQNLRNP